MGPWVQVFWVENREYVPAYPAWPASGYAHEGSLLGGWEVGVQGAGAREGSIEIAGGHWYTAVLCTPGWVPTVAAPYCMKTGR